MALIKSAGSGSDPTVGMSLIRSMLVNFTCMVDESGGVQLSKSEEGFKSRLMFCFVLYVSFL